MIKKVFSLFIMFLCSACVAGKTIHVNEDKFNSSVKIISDNLCSDFVLNSCYLTYYKDKSKETYYISGNVYIDYGIRGTNLYKALDINSKELKMAVTPDSRLGWYNDYYEVKLLKDYLEKDIEIKLYGHQKSKVIKISAEDTRKFTDRVDEYKVKGK